MYGQNQPCGFRVQGTTQNSVWKPNLQGPFQIEPGYAQNIGQGDFVILDPATNYLRSYYDLNTLYATTAPFLGTFQYCTYRSSPGSFPLQGPIQHPAYYAGTVTANGAPVEAYVEVGLETVGTMQSNQLPIVPTAAYLFAQVVFDVSSGVVQLNTDGTSRMAINATTITNVSTLAVRILQLDPNPQNTTGVYNNVLAQMQSKYGPGNSFSPVSVP